MKLENLFVDATEEDDLYILKELFENYKISVDVDHKSSPGVNIKVVEWLLEQKADIEKEDEEG